MKEPVLRLALKAALFLIVFGTAAPLRADVLTVCNNGTVSVVVVTAMKNADLARGLGKYYWAITSTAVPTGARRNHHRLFAISGHATQEVRQRPLDSGRQDHRNDWAS